MATEPNPPQPQPQPQPQPPPPPPPPPQPAPRDHDQRGKELIQVCLPELMDWLRPQWREHFRFDRPQWLKQEIFVDPPSGDRILIDLVAKVPAVKPIPHHRLPGRKVKHALFHIEVENSKSMVLFRPRVASYSMDLERRHDLPTFSHALLLRVGQEGVGEDEHAPAYFGSETRRTKWLYAGLPALDGLKYIEEDNLLAIALSPLMRIDPQLKMEACAKALQKIHEAKVSPQKRFLLGECVQAYGQLNSKRWERFLKSLTNPSLYSGADAMMSLVFREGCQKGRQEGRVEGRLEGRLEGQLEGQHKAFLRMLKVRFPTLGPDVERQVQALTEDDVNRLIPSVFTVQTFDELDLPRLDPHSGNGNGKA